MFLLQLRARQADGFGQEKGGGLDQVLGAVIKCESWKSLAVRGAYLRRKSEEQKGGMG